jgi:hypothetical protein
MVLLSVACWHAAPKPAEAQRMLTGRWELKIGHDCQDYGIRSDILILHADGTMEQHSVFTNGERYDATDGHWSYEPENLVHFQGRRDLTRDGPYFSTVEFGSPSVILLNPKRDCLYHKVADH